MNELKIEKEGAADIYNQLIELIGEEGTRRVFQTFRGQQVTFPKRFYKSEYVMKEVRRRYDGTNLHIFISSSHNITCYCQISFFLNADLYNQIP